MEGRSSLVSELDARRLLELAKRDRRAASEALAALSLGDQVALVCQAPVGRRAALLELTPEPEAVIPLLPVAELCFTTRAVGLADASWLLEHATPEQIVGCVDLDAWSGIVPDRDAMAQWFATLAEAGPETLLRAAHALDAEMLVLLLREHTEVFLDPKDDDWEPPDGSQTIDGQFHFRARQSGDDLAPIVALLHSLFRGDYWLYFRLMQGVIWELESDLEEWSLRWRTGRLGDLGFPSWDEAMRIYGFVRPEKRADIDESIDPLAVSEWMLPVWIDSLPAASDARHAVFRGAAALDEDERRAFFYAFVAIANKVAVADAMPLSDVETLPKAIEKVATVASRGLEYVTSERGMSLADGLRSVTLERLFRVGASLDPESSHPVIQALARRLLGLPARRCACVVEREWVTTPDDVRLATLHYWPVGLRDAPVLLIRTPYDVSGAASRFLLRLLAESGFHVVGQDVRGRYRSEGRFEPFANEVADGTATLAWLREQSWCNAPVGVFGASYTAYTAWAALGGSPDDVGAIASAIGSRDLYPVFHPGGAFSLGIALEWATGVGDDVAIPARRIDLERGLDHRPVREADRVALRQIDAYRDWIDHPRRDAFWNGLLPALPESPPPSLTIAGWYDFFLSAQVDEYDQLARRCAERGLPTPELVIGPWTHGGMAARRWRRGNGMAGEALRRIVAFFGRTLGKSSEPAGPAPVRYFCGEDDWRAASHWPPHGVATSAFYLSSGGRANGSSGDGALVDEAPDPGHDAFESDPASPVPSLGGARFGRHAGVADQARVAARRDVLCYATAPLDRALEVAGRVRLTLHVSADAPDADFAAKLVDLSPEGQAVNVCEGIQRARWRSADQREVEPRWLEPDHVDELTIDLGPAAWLFRPGHRIRVDIAGSNFPRFDRSPGSSEAPSTATRSSASSVVQTLHHGGRWPSRLLLNADDE